MVRGKACSQSLLGVEDLLLSCLDELKGAWIYHPGLSFHCLLCLHSMGMVPHSGRLVWERRRMLCWKFVVHRHQGSYLPMMLVLLNVNLQITWFCLLAL